MEKELINHLKKVKKISLDTKKSFWEKTKEISGEILIITFAVSLSIYFHNWSEHNHNLSKVKEYSIDIKNDIRNDIDGFIEAKEALQNVKTSFEGDSSKIPTIMCVKHMPHNANFEALKFSGDIGLIENKKFKSELLKYYLQFAPAYYLNEAGLIEETKILRGELKDIENPNKSLLFSSKYKYYTKKYLNSMEGHILNCDQIIKMAQHLQETINSTIDE